MAQRGLAVKIAIGKPKPGGGDMDGPSEIGAPPAPPDAAPPDQDDQPSGRPYPDPAAVGFRQPEEDCQHCEYDQDGTCLILNVPIGLTCNAYEAKEDETSDMGAPAQPGGMPPEMGA